MKNKLHLIIGVSSFVFSLIVTFILLYPGVWWPDSLNAFIQQKTGVYGAAQPPLLALLCGITSKIASSSYPLFLFFAVIYLGGLTWLVFNYIKDNRLATSLYFILSFFPLTFAAIGVVQTETLQMACLNLFVPACIFAERFQQPQRIIVHAIGFALLLLFSLARYENTILCIPLSYLWAYGTIGVHCRKTIKRTIITVILIQIIAAGVLRLTGIDDRLKSEMQLSLLVCDIAAISVEANKNYVPDFCWQKYLPENEKTVQKIAQGYYGWKGAFYSYTFSVDPAVGLFGYNNYDRRFELYSVWFKTVFKNPYYYLLYHTKLFAYLLLNDYFNMGLYSGVHDSKESRSKLLVEYNKEVEEFIKKHDKRFLYKNKGLFFNESGIAITTEEKIDLKKLVPIRRESDVIWMQWYSNIPSTTYTRINPAIEKILIPASDFLRHWFWFFCTLAPYCVLLFLIGVYACLKLQPSENRFYILLFSACGLLHIAMRFIFLTDTVFRFGLLALAFLLLVVPIFTAELLEQKRVSPKGTLLLGFAILCIALCFWLMNVFSFILVFLLLAAPIFIAELLGEKRLSRKGTLLIVFIIFCIALCFWLVNFSNYAFWFVKPYNQYKLWYPNFYDLIYTASYIFRLFSYILLIPVFLLYAGWYFKPLVFLLSKKFRANE